MIAVKVPPRPADWYKIHNRYYYHFFYDGEDRSICGHVDRSRYPEGTMIKMDTSLPIGVACLDCRRRTKR